MIIRRFASLQALSGLLCILVLSFYTYIPGYSKPADLFWDENFHIASAQRYLNGIFFLEPHPPLGKLFIAAGEYLLQANADNDQFTLEEKAEEIPPGFSFSGYRFFPVLFGALIPALLYGIIFQLSKNPFYSFIIALAPTFDNAFIVHNRGAMLESAQIFFLLLATWAYVSLQKNKSYKKTYSIVLGFCCAAAVGIKINSLPVLILPFILLIDQKNFRHFFLSLFTCLFTYLGIWHLHFSIAKRIEPNLQTDGLFGVSSDFEKILTQGSAASLLNLPASIIESFQYTARYQQGVPELDYAKSEENGSSPFFWPFGGRTINYRWSQSGEATHYLYLVPNIASWALGLLGILWGTVTLCRKFFKRSLSLEDGRFLVPFCIIYFASWLSPLAMKRVFYLYHYLVPLTFSWIILGVCLMNHQSAYSQIKRLTRWGIAYIGVLISVFIYFSPLTYYRPLSDQSIKNRNWLPLWDIRCHDCPSVFFSDTPLSNTYRTDPTWRLSIGDLEANRIEQSEGTPLQKEDTFEFVTKSKVQFPLNKEFTRFTGKIGLSEPIKDRHIEFKIIVDGEVVWKRHLNSTSNSTEEFDIPLYQKTLLVLTAQTIPRHAKSCAGEWQNLKLFK